MKTPWHNLEGYPRAIVASVCILLLSGGLCGVQWAVIWIPHFPEWMVGPFEVAGFAELLAMGGASLVLIVSLIAWPISAILRQGKGKGNTE